MAFKSIHHVLGKLESHYNLQEQRNFQALLCCWSDVVGAIVAAQTRPTAIQRGVLYVATSSSPWAQNLVFERQRILEKLNASLSYTLADIRFSPAQWKNGQPVINSPGSEAQTELWHNHPCRVSSRADRRQRGEWQELTDPLLAFQGWAQLMRSRSQHLPTCPQCKSPTPAGELERWSMCSLCIAKRWL